MNKHDIRRLVDVVAFPTKIVYGIGENGRKSFFFLMDTPGGAYNLLEIYADKRGNLSSKTYYKTKKGVSQRVMNILNSLHSTSVADGATLSNAKVSQMFENTNIESENSSENDATRKPMTKEEARRMVRELVVPFAKELREEQERAQATEDSGTRFRITPEMNAEYMAAVENGDMLRNAPAIDVNEGVITSTKELSARKAAEKWWDENVAEPAFYDTEVGEVEISRNSVESSLAHRYGQAKLDALTSLIEGFENAVYLGSMPDGTRHGGVMNHYYACPINYKGERCYVFCRAMHDANKNRLYVHEVFIADRIKKGDTLQTAASQLHGGIALYKDILANVLDLESTSASEDRNSVSNSQENAQKSGEIADWVLARTEDKQKAKKGAEKKTADGQTVLYRTSEDAEDIPRLDKHRVEKIFGGIWIDDAEEFAKFASAVNNSPFEENGEGVAYTDNYFYAYYLNIDGQVIPFASVYLNSLESQEVVNRYNQEIKENGKQRRVREYIDRAYELARNIQSKRDAEFGIDKGASNPRRNDSLDSNISRKGRYYDRPDLYVKTKRADRFGIVERSGSGPLTDREVVMESDVYSKVLGKPRYYGQKQRNYVARQRAKMAQKATKLAEETLCYFVGSRPRLIGYLKDGRNDLTSFYRFVDKNYKRFIDFAQNLIDYTVYHEEEIEHRERFAGFGEIAETTTEGGNGVHQRNSEIERDRTATTGGLTEEEIALLEASTGYTREEIIDMFGYDLNREGAGPLTDREVVMESDPYSKVLGKPRYYGQKQRNYVARQRAKMAQKATKLAEKLEEAIYNSDNRLAELEQRVREVLGIYVSVGMNLKFI